ncbi:MAG: hypothetical protein JWM88_2206 [Verrucomicrobia bacterium]|nr:hypothetical protein [Verrucomicrobiota bacterium]
MPTLRQLLAAHAPLLVIDAASAKVQVGWLERGGGTRWAASQKESGVGVFESLQQLGVQPGDAGAFVFCDGPGSILGVRTVAMAIRTWTVLSPRPAFAYHSLALVFAGLARPTAKIIADARRDSWHCFSADGKLRRVAAAELAGPLVMPEGFRHWTPAPPGLESVPYQVEGLLARSGDAEIFRETAAPDAFLHEEPSYVTWTPQVHRAP